MKNAVAKRCWTFSKPGESYCERFQLNVKVEAKRAEPYRILPLITDTIFLLLAAYLLFGYARNLLNSLGAIYFIVRQGVFTLYLIMSIILLLIRKEQVAYSKRLSDYVYTLLGLGSPLLFTAASSIADIPAEFLEVTGSLLVLCGFLSLNKSFGLGPENRGVKMKGAYRLVRHPMYSGYILTEIGFFFGNYSLYNLLVLAASILFLLLRMRAEEQLLRKDASYLEYSRIVRWRLLPYIF